MLVGLSGADASVDVLRPVCVRQIALSARPIAELEATLAKALGPCKQLGEEHRTQRVEVRSWLQIGCPGGQDRPIILQGLGRLKAGWLYAVLHMASDAIPLPDRRDTYQRQRPR